MLLLEILLINLPIEGYYVWPYVVSFYVNNNSTVTCVRSYHPEDGGDMFFGTSGLTRATRCNNPEDILQQLIKSADPDGLSKPWTHCIFHGGGCSVGAQAVALAGPLDPSRL
jgi:hypothetical protein